MRKIILATHGELANGMLHSLTMIVGDLASDVQTYCLQHGGNPNDYMEAMKVTIMNEPHHEYVFLCDLKGGSVHTALSQLCIFSNVLVFSGLNMNLVLDIVLSHPDVITTTSEAMIIQHAREGITVTTNVTMSVEDDEEF